MAPRETPNFITWCEIVERRGLTVTEAAAALQVGRPALSNFLHGHAALSPDMAVRLEQVFGLDAAALWQLKVDADLARARALCPALPRHAAELGQNEQS